MNSTTDLPPSPDYGVDAPGVVRNLFACGAAGFLIFATAWLGWWSGDLVLPLPGLRVEFPVAGSGLWIGIACTLMGVWMLWDSKVGKQQDRERLLDRIEWTGEEQVLDLGCGRGLLLVGVARRLTTGKATGIDIWQSEDLSGNRPEAALENARREGVADRVATETADMRKMPFGDNTFDVVVSRAAIHNLYQSAERAKAIGEVVRVLKPGGQVVIEDIRHLHEYAAEFSRRGCTDIQHSGSVLVALFLALVTWGSLRPGILIVRKPASAGSTMA